MAEDVIDEYSGVGGRLVGAVVEVVAEAAAAERADMKDQEKSSAR
jgi:hypothetical protein